MAEPKAKKLDILSNDRISLLPEPILHHILCSLSQKEAIKTCVLSKAWRYLGCTRPKIDWRDHKDLYSPAFLDKILQGYHDRNLRLDEFSLWLSEDNVDPVHTFSLLNKWIPTIIQDMRVKNIKLGLNERPQPFELPSSLILEAQDIQSLSLLCCILRSTARVPVRVDLKRLHTLYLYGVFIPQEILDNILSNCPFLRKVSLLYCKGFKRIKPRRLAYFYFCGCVEDKADYNGIKIWKDVKTLKTVKLDKCLFSVSPNKPLEFARLKLLTLTSVRLPFESFSCNLHCLEVMKLDKCSGIKEFNLSSRSMKRLDIHNIRKPFKATIDAPSIVSFNYKGILPQSISFATTSSDELWKSKISLGSSASYNFHLFRELYGLLKAVSQSSISLTLDQDQILRFGSQLHIGVSKEAKHELPIAVEHLRIKRLVRNVHSPAELFLNMLFRMFRPSFVYMDILINSNYQRSCEITELLLKERETTIWECVLEGVSLQTLYQNQREWQPVEHTSFMELSKKTAESKEFEFRFHLKWRD